MLHTVPILFTGSSPTALRPADGHAGSRAPIGVAVLSVIVGRWS
jgi:hypothetical protein